jgi:hypothetical protein
VGIPRPTGGGTPRSRSKGRGIEVKVKKVVGGCVPSQTTPTQKGVCSGSFDGKCNVLPHGFFPNNDEC